MYFFKNNKSEFSNKALNILFLIFTCLLIGGCSAEGTGEENGGEAEETVDLSEQAIRTVIEKEFNGPDEKYKELWDAAMEAQISDKYEDDYEAYLESPEYQALAGYTEDTYASYFTENGYDNFVNQAPAFMYSVFDGEYKLHTSAIEIVQSEREETLYDFTFQVEYTNENGESSQYNFEGNAIAPVEGEIGKIEYMDGYEDILINELKSNE